MMSHPISSSHITEQNHKSNKTIDLHLNRKNAFHSKGNSNLQIHNEHEHDLSTNALERIGSAKVLSEQEIQQYRLVEQYIFAKLESYLQKSRVWQLSHSLKLKRHLLGKSQRIAELHSLSDDFVRDSIHQIFNNVDRQVLQLRLVTRSLINKTKEPVGILQNFKKNDNRWHSIQLTRAREILKNNDIEQLTHDEIIQKYRTHIIHTLTPEPDVTDMNCIAQLRAQPFDLDAAYQQSELKAKTYLGTMLNDYNKRLAPNLEVIQEMVNIGNRKGSFKIHTYNNFILALDHMRKMPTNEDCENAKTFLSKINIIRQTKEAYEYGLHNMGDDFMLLRFGKIFGSNASTSTEMANKQFIYLVHLFIKSLSNFVLLTQETSNEIHPILSTIAMVTTNFVTLKPRSSFIRLDDEHLLSPEENVDRWTWLLEKWLDALRTFPIILTEVGAFGRLVRTTIGIGIARLFNFAETMIVNNNQTFDLAYLNEKLFHALQMGFYFGLAYAIVDCVQDEFRNLDKKSNDYLTALHFQPNSDDHELTSYELMEKWLLIMEKLLCGEEFNRSEIPKTPLTPLLLETFDGLITLTKDINITCSAFNELALLLRSQRIDKKTINEFYTDEDIFLGAMLKSHFTYTCTTYLGNIKSAREESERLWIMPFLGQLTDDCRDFHDDIISKSVTSFTHYSAFIGRQQTTDKHLLNPFHAFLYLCTDLYLNSNCDIQTGAFIGRRILRTLKSIETSYNASGLREFLHIFCQNNLPLQNFCSTYLHKQFDKVTDPEKSFFRAINKASVKYARTNRKLETYVGDHLQTIENALHITSVNTQVKSKIPNDRDEQLLLAGMNYSVKAGGKRLRPLLLLMASDLYGIPLKHTLPLACGIEYLHTSSLIMDDLPAQDNSDLRRGRPTLHKATIDDDVPDDLCEGRAQLTAVDLIAMSISVINSDLVKNGFPAETVNRIITEISFSMHDLCIGQMMDLRAARMGLLNNIEVVDELDRIAWLKTGKAIEIVLITPAILAHSLSDKNEEVELNRLRELSRLMGILFQMRDDLLDIDGENIGKPAGLDVHNHTATYVSILGAERTRTRLREFHRKALQLLDECWPDGAGTIKDVVNYIANRKN